VIAALGVFVAALALGVATAVANPGPTSPPQPGGPGADAKLSHSIQAVNAQLARLARQNDQLDEQYNVAAAATASAKRTARQAQLAADRADARYRNAHARFVQALMQQYESVPGASIGSLMTSQAPQDYLDYLSMTSYLSGEFADTMRLDRAVRADAAAATRRANSALATARAKEAGLAQQRAALAQESQRFTRTLDSLTKQQRAERARARALAAAKARAQLAAQQKSAASTGTSSGGSTPPPTGPVSGSVARVIAFAEAQVGKSYVFAASGPNSYDCSGLTMAAWAQAGVSLPHSAAGQYGYGRHVSFSQLQPGDLIFLYSPIGHVEIYVGHDLAVSAADPSIGIVYVHPSQDMADFAGATRLTG
jgi:cell wall-associated NlpC family hydrolase